jgi:hypothetical protein
VDHGSRDAERHRLGLVNGASDPALSASLSGILFAHGVLDRRQRDAADDFRRARAACFGVVLPDRDPSTRREATEDQIAKN